MKMLFLVSAFSFHAFCFAWTTVESFEAESALALTCPASLTNETFVSSLTNACQESEDVQLRLSAQIVQSVLDYHYFCETGDRIWTERCSATLSNVLWEATALTNCCNYWTAQVLYAGSEASRGHYQAAYSICTNVIARADCGEVVSGTNRFTCALMSYYRMDGLTVPNAARYVAGMAAAVQGDSGAASNLAVQVASPYREEILDFLQN